MLPIYSAQQTRQWDLYTLEKEGITSLELMESAAYACSDWLLSKFGLKLSYLIFCGNGNNGGDGICMARHLAEQNFDVYVLILELSHKASPEFLINFKRLQETGLAKIIDFQQAIEMLKREDEFLLVDAIFGSGLNRPPSAEVEQIIVEFNASNCIKVSIDIPSGMYSDHLPNHAYIISDYTLCLQCPKLSGLLPESGKAYGQIAILDIGLNPLYLKECLADKWYLQINDIQNLIIHRTPFDYKTKFGHVLAIGGCRGMSGALLMASKAALRSGCGLCSMLSVEENRVILQTALPEAMFCSTDSVNWEKYNVLLIGPGMGNEKILQSCMLELLCVYDKKLVLDADALNMIKDVHYFKTIKAEIVITPHVGEFDRLFGKSAHDFDRLKLAIESAKNYNITIILKGHYTAIISCDGTVYFNTSGNAGLAKGGSGDVLSGMVGAFLAQAYPTLDACLLAVYLHGYTADFLLHEMAMETIMATDIIDALPRSFAKLKMK